MLARVFARDAAHRVAWGGLRLVRGAGGAEDSRLAELEAALRIHDIAAAEAGGIARHGRGRGRRLRPLRRNHDDASEPVDRAVAIVGVAAIMPDAPDAATFWQNIQDGRYSISEVTPDRWDPALYYDPDPQAPDKSYSKIGGWVRDFEWDPLGWKLPIPPRVGDAMDDTQKWAVNLARAALVDYGWPERPLDNERTAVVIGNAMAGERHYLTALRINFPEFARELEGSATFAALPQEVREAIVDETGKRPADRHPRHHRGHHAGRAGQHHRRPGRQPLQLPRAELRHRRGLRVRAWRPWPPRSRG